LRLEYSNHVGAIMLPAIPIAPPTIIGNKVFISSHIFISALTSVFSFHNFDFAPVKDFVQKKSHRLLLCEVCSEPKLQTKSTA
jgi:hypothetical protein